MGARAVYSRLFNTLLRRTSADVYGNNVYRSFSTDVAAANNQTLLDNMKRELLHLDVTSQIGSCMPLAAMRIGTIIHNIEVNPGQGGKLVRAAGTCAKILKDPRSRYCLIKLPSGDEKLIDSRCRATIGTVSNPSHGARKLRKAGQSRWLGRRPVVRGVAMNPVDHPHGGGEGKSKSSGNHGRLSQTPWGKPCKGGYKTGRLKRKTSSA
ncbi:60S ribosomal protein L2, mitochondrial [Tripterygium wilfordii]|uniref:60S ribosomal protein L2, mitochondrial n=1 Tax=Tripterygium wilfordii TaxID=458696 RepID=UPI0018F7F543|nr:60S ribosomal protein L2, mitochondrial [Tripterygium wilfordii]